MGRFLVENQYKDSLRQIRTFQAASHAEIRKQTFTYITIYNRALYDTTMSIQGVCVAGPHLSLNYCVCLLTVSFRLSGGR